jgi:hypothetical protein
MQKQEKRGYLWIALALLALLGSVVYFFVTHATPDQGFPAEGWCYQNYTAGSGRYGAFCVEHQQDCETYRVSATVPCQFVHQMDLQMWGGVKPTNRGNGKWFRSNLLKPLPPPFPQPLGPNNLRK